MISNSGVIESVKIVYFSGTGCSKKFVDHLQSEFEEKNIKVFIHPLDQSLYNDLYTEGNISGADLMVLVFPVHAFDAPKPVYDWIEKLGKFQGALVSVISVSAGGEGIANNACRNAVISKLEEKGYIVFYERMIIMPNNFAVKTQQGLTIRLLGVLPHKAKNCVEELINRKTRRIRVPLISKIITYVGKSEKYFAKYFGGSLVASNKCIGCGLCAKKCPVRNIVLVDKQDSSFGEIFNSHQILETATPRKKEPLGESAKKLQLPRPADVHHVEEKVVLNERESDKQPAFAKKCVMCMKCLYDCPTSAIISKYFKFAYVKEGFNINKLEEESKRFYLRAVENVIDNSKYKRFKDYLTDESV